MNKLEMLNRIAENLELMRAIERVVDLSDQDPFINSIQTEWHVLRKENGYIIDQYKRYGAVEEIPPSDEEKVEPCGYCGTSTDPNHICKPCWEAMPK